MKATGLSCFVMLLFLFPGISGYSQKHDDAAEQSEIIQDSRVDLLVKKHIQINQIMNTIEGFRIQIFSESGTNSKNKAQAVHDAFQNRFAGVGVYLSFKSPNYKVRIGDFRTKLDAQRFLVELTADYPNAFIIADQINLPKPD